MDYQGCKHPLPTLYTLRPEGIRCYFSDRVACSIEIRVDLTPVCRSVESSLHSLATEEVLGTIIRVSHWQWVQIKQTGFTGIGLFRHLDDHANQFRLVRQHGNETGIGLD